jgi:hypothetical protein
MKRRSVIDDPSWVAESVGQFGVQPWAIPARQKSRAAFTLVEVMIAMGIFFMAMFTILDLMSRSLGAARSLKQSPVDFTEVVYDLVLTNRLQEVSESGDLGEQYPDVTWNRDIYLIGTNGLFQVDVTIFQPGAGAIAEHKMSMLLYRPESPMRPGGGPR